MRLGDSTHAKRLERLLLRYSNATGNVRLPSRLRTDSGTTYFVTGANKSSLHSILLTVREAGR